MANSFKIHFDNDDYNHKGWDILPDIDEYLKHDVLINYDEYKKGNISKCIWKRQPEPAIITNDFIEQELRRILRTGVFICIKDEIFWIPPNYYTFLQYFPTGGEPAQFRIKRLKHVYFKIWVRNNPFAIGTYTIKNRQDGETTMAMSDSLWEAADGNMNVGTIGMQSKTRDTVLNSCWRILVMGWNGFPDWLKYWMYPDFASGDKIAEKLKFMRKKDSEHEARDIQILFGASTHNAFDSFNNMRRCILDEVNKWIECSFYKTFTNYKQFIAPARTRKGLFDIFSSPSDTNGVHNEEAHLFWKGSDWSRLLETKSMTTDTRIFRYYSDPLEGIEGMYDEFGDADPLEIEDFIISERRKVPKDKQMEEVRACPLNEEEMFGSHDGGSIWSNETGIKERKIFLMHRRFKDPETKEPVNIYGNLEWPEGIVDFKPPVFRQADVEDFDVVNARWCFSYLPLPQEQFELKQKWNNDLREYRFTPPPVIINSLGVDPYNKRYAQGRKSNGGMVNWKFLDPTFSGIVKCPTMIYDNRPQHETTFYEDIIKSAVFLRAMIQLENITAGAMEYIEDRGYFDWLLPARGEKRGSKKIGDNPSGKGGFLNEGIALINSVLNTPVTPEDPYLLQRHWFYRLLDDNTNFDPKNTEKSHLTMAQMQAMVGAVKMMMLNRDKKPNSTNQAVMDYLFG